MSKIVRFIAIFSFLCGLSSTLWANETRWEDVSSIVNESKNSLNSIKVQNEEEYLKIEIEGKDIGKHTAVYLDIDDDENTGFYSDLWEHSGMDYLIEDGRLYKSLGRKWSWEHIANVEYKKDKNRFEITIDKELLEDMSDKFKIGVTHSGSDWKIISKLPSSKKIAKFPKVVRNDGFAHIRDLIEKAKEGEYDDVIYICVGDSTRAKDWYYGGGHIFDRVSRELRKYNVRSYLEAVAGYTAKEYARGFYYPSWKDTVSLIKGDGSHAIVDISLGINDARYYGGMGKAPYIKASLKTAIDNILRYKPKTNFMLTMPNKMIGLDHLVKEYREAYLEFSKERNIPLVDTISNIFEGGDDFSLYRDMDAQDYGANIRIHLSKKGQDKVADLILSYILPE